MGATSDPDSETLVVASTDAPAPNPDREIAQGESLGRYMVLDVVGRGGMGSVYRAYDPKLRREVALKVLRSDRGAQADERRVQLVAEAQAMARLSHPNVLPVFDVEDGEARVFIAMEYVEGVTLRQWIDEHERSPSEILSVFLDAGRGLAAAHAAGIVHRDFKPTNVLIGADGRVRVMDFGLALEHAPRQNDLDANIPPWGSTTQSIVAGTPAYMSPEQHRGEPVDARSDQFSFCTALFEALHGRRAFGGETLEELAASKSDGRVAEPEVGGGLPGRVQRVLARGLRPQPEDRYESMTTLIDALQRADRPGRGRLVAVAAVGLVAVAAIGATWWDRTPPAPTCTPGAELFASAWSPARRDAMTQALLATEVGYAAETADRVSAVLDGYADRWVQDYDAACTASRAPGAGEDEMAHLQLACLHRARVQLEAVVGVLADAPDPALVRRASQTVGQLAPLDECSDRALLEGMRPQQRDAETLAAVAAVDDDLARLTGLEGAGKLEEAEALAKELVARAHEIDDAVLTARVQLKAGKVAMSSAEHDVARARYLDGYQAAIRARNDRLSALLASNMAVLLGYHIVDATAADEWIAVAKAWFDRRAVADFAMTVHLHHLGNIASRRGDADATRRAYERLREVYDELGVTDAIRRSDVENSLGIAAMLDGRLVDATEFFTRSHELYVEAYGAHHPTTAMPLVNHGLALFQLDRGAEAEVLLRRALEIWLPLYGERNERVASLRVNLGLALKQQDRYEEAEQQQRMAMEARVALLGPDHPEVAITINNLGTLADVQGRFEEALRYHEQALEIRREAFGDENRDVALSHANVGQALLGLGRNDEAVAAFRRALDIRKRVLPAGHSDLGLSYVQVGEGLRRMGDLAEARPSIEHGIEILASAQGARDSLGRARVALARTRVALGVRREDIEPLVTKGLTDLASAGAEEDAAEARAWWASLAP